MGQECKINFLRKNLFDNEWSIYAPNRAVVNSISDSVAHEFKTCPFCLGAEEINADYEVCILPNRYPSFSSKNCCLDQDEFVAQGYGHQDVFLFNSDHNSYLFEQTVARIVKLLSALGTRVNHHYQDSKIEAVALFENSGTEFGPSIKHPHGQIFALPFIPKRLQQSSEKCLLCDYINSENYGANIIHENNSALLVCPWSARFPYEMNIFPKQHLAGLTDLSTTELFDVASLLKLALQLLNAVETGSMSYMLLFYVAPKKYLNNYHLRIELLPINKPFGGRKYLGGLELGYGVYVNPSLPEQIAASLREMKANIKCEC